jgi:hypothetical protein
MTDRSKWGDERIDDLAAVVRELQPISKDVATALVQIANTNRDVEEILRRQARLEEKMDEDVRERRQGRSAVVVAAIAASATVLAAIIAAIVAFIG